MELSGIGIDKMELTPCLSACILDYFLFSGNTGTLLIGSLSDGAGDTSSSHFAPPGK